jgi:hypothetical protein
MKPAFAFDVCHDLYRVARAVLDSNLHSTDFASHDKYLWRPGLRPRLAEYVADFEIAGKRALASPHLASRLVLFRVHYLGGAELHAARAHLGIGELTWEQWSDEVKARVGRELLRRRMFPPRDYFRDTVHQRAEAKPGPRDSRASTKPHAPRDPRVPREPHSAVNSPHPTTPRGKRAEPLFVRVPNRNTKLAS